MSDLPAPVLRQPSAGDLFLRAASEWMEHAEACGIDECETCVLLFNRARLARKVYQNSAHQRVTAKHRCSGCGHRWDGELSGAELCGDCWRRAQSVLHA